MLPLLALACAISDRCDPKYEGRYCEDTGSLNNNPTTDDITPPIIEAYVNDELNDPSIFYSNTPTEGTIYNDADCEVYLPIDIYTEEEPASLQVFAGDYNPYEGWTQERRYNGDNLNITSDYIEVSSNTYAYKLEGNMEAIEVGAQYLYTYDPYSDHLVDDVPWLFPFYVVATDEAGNMSTPQQVQFETRGDYYCDSHGNPR